MKYFPCFLLFFLLQLSFVSNAQEGEDKNGIRKASLSLNAGGASPFLGLSAEYLIADRVNLEAGVGIISVGGGITIYPKKVKGVKTWNTYFGAKGFIIPLVDIGILYASYFPIGTTYFGDSRTSFGVDIGPGFGWIDDEEKYIFGGFGNLKFALRF